MAMAKRALGILDGGPANGMLIELDQSHWAPIGLIEIDVEGGEAIYVLARQRRPEEGQPWRYVPEGSPDAAVEEDDPRLPTPAGPYDD